MIDHYQQSIFDGTEQSMYNQSIELIKTFEEDVRQTDTCYTKNYFIVNPLAYWNDNYLWNYIHSERLEINPLYSQGFDRVGCIGCPMAGLHRLFEFERYPKYKARFIKLCDDIMELR